MKKHFKILSLMVLAGLLFPSCASIFTKNSYPLSVTSSPEGAEVEIYNKDNRLVYSGTTPAMTVLSVSDSYMSKQFYIIKIKKDGYKPYEYMIECKLEGWYFGNLLLGGVIGMLIVDPLTGSMYKFSEKNIIAKLTPDTADNSAQMSVMLLDDVPEDMRASLVMITE